MGQQTKSDYHQLWLALYHFWEKSEFAPLEFLVLDLVGQSEIISILELRERLGITHPSSMTRLIHSLERHLPPLISCQRNRVDNRRIDVSMTAAGARIYDQCAAELAEIVQSSIRC